MNDFEKSKKLLFEFEKKYDPFSYRQEEYNYSTWVTVREKLYKFIRNDFTTPDKSILSSEKKKINLKSFMITFKRLIDFLKKRNLLKKEIDIIFITNSYFRRGENSSNIFFDNIIDKLDSNINYIILELPTLTNFDKQYFHSKYKDKIIPLDLFALGSFINEFRYKRKYDKAITRDIDEFFKQNVKYEKNPQLFKEKELIEYIKPMWKENTLKFLAWKNTFEIIYEKITPKIIVEVANAGKYAKSIYENEVGFVEIQHGIIHPYHMGYIYPKLPSVNNLISKREVILYGNYYKNLLLSKSNFQDQNLHVIGNPLYKSPKDYKVGNSKRTLEKLGIKKEKKIILVSSQYEKEIREPLYSFVNQLSDLIKKEYYIVMKLHPREKRDHLYYSLKRDENLILVESSCTVEELLKVSSVHLSVSSTVLLEAILFKVPNYILNTNYTGYIDKILEGKAKIVDTPMQFLNIINDPENLNPQYELSKLSQNLYGNSKNVNEEIAALLNEKILRLKKI